MSLTYWPKAEYASAPGVVKRHQTTSPFSSLSTAISKANSWHSDSPLLSAWVDVKDGEKRIDKVKLLLSEEENLWTGESTLPTVDTLPSTPPSISQNSTTIAIENPIIKNGRKFYSDATKVALVQRTEASSLSQVARETGIGQSCLSRWRDQVRMGKLTAPLPTDAEESGEQLTMEVSSPANTTPVENTIKKSRHTPYYSVEQKITLVARLKEIGPTALSRETGVAQSALYRWKKQLENGELVSGGDDSAATSDDSAQLPSENNAPAAESVDENAEVENIEVAHTTALASERVGGRIYDSDAIIKTVKDVLHRGTSYVSRQTGIPRETLKRWKEMAVNAGIVEEAEPDETVDHSYSYTPVDDNVDEYYDSVVASNDASTASEPDSVATYIPASFVENDEDSVSEDSAADESSMDEHTDISPSEQTDYSDAEKLAILDRVALDGMVVVSKELGIPKTTLRSWKRRAKRGRLEASVEDTATADDSSVATDADDSKVDKTTDKVYDEETRQTIISLASELGVEAVSAEMGVDGDLIRAWMGESAPATDAAVDNDSHNIPVNTSPEISSETAPATTHVVDSKALAPNTVPEPKATSASNTLPASNTLLTPAEDITAELMALRAENRELKLQLLLLNDKLSRYKKAIGALME